MPGILNMVGAGLSAAGGAVAQFGNDAGVLQLKSQLEDQSMRLASSLRTQEAYAAPGATEAIQSAKLNLARTKAQLASIGITLDDQGNVSRTPAPNNSDNTTPAPSQPSDQSASSSPPETDKGDEVIVSGNGKVPAITASMLPPGMSVETAKWLALNGADKLAEAVAKSYTPVQLREHSSLEGRDPTTGAYTELTKNYGTTHPITDADRLKYGLKPTDIGYIDENDEPHLLKDQSNAAPSVDRDVLMPILQKMKRGETLTNGEQKVLATMKPGSSPANDESIKTVAHAIANYQQPMLSGFVLKTPWGQQAAAQVYAENPDYRAENYNAANKAQSAFASGTQGNQVRSINVAISHLGTLDDLGKALNNGDVQALNRAKQFFSQQFGQAAPASFDAVKQIVGQEVTKAVVVGGGGVTERQQAADAVSRANSPEQLAGVIGTYKRLLAGQLGGLRRQYETQTRSNNFEDMLSPEAKNELENLPESTGNLGADNGGGNVTKGPAAGTVLNGYRFKGGNPNDKTNWEAVH